MIHSLPQLLTESAHHIIYAVISGSQAYGTATADSDEDVKGVFVIPAQQYLSLSPPPKQVSDDKHDVVYYSLHRLLELLSEANPNLLELLYTPANCVKKHTEVIQPLLQQRHHFVTQQCVDAHVGYAISQVKKARGHNKWINKPQPKHRPSRDQFCWLLEPHVGNALPMRPKPLAETTIRLDDCHCASLEHVPGVYRLYHYGRTAKGVFRAGTLVCESIPKDEEQNRFCGLLIFNEPAWRQAKRDHTHYWAWRANRNEARWQQQEKGDIDYDAKNMMHTLRLLLSADHMLDNGIPKVRFDGVLLSLLRDVRAGQYTYAELTELAEMYIDQCRVKRQSSGLPEKVDRQLSERLLQEMTQQWTSLQANNRVF